MFPTGNVEVPAGTSLLLGRDPAESLVAAAFASYENVSRRHATVTVDDPGHATIRDEHSTNGTFVNGDRVLPGTAVRLVDGDASGWPPTSRPRFAAPPGAPYLARSAATATGTRPERAARRPAATMGVGRAVGRRGGQPGPRRAVAGPGVVAGRHAGGGSAVLRLRSRDDLAA